LRNCIDSCPHLTNHKDAARKGTQREGGCCKTKEALLKVCLQPWIDEAFTITVDIKNTNAQMQGLYALRQGFYHHKEASEERMQQV